MKPDPLAFYDELPRWQQYANRARIAIAALRGHSVAFRLLIDSDRGLIVVPPRRHTVIGCNFRGADAFSIDWPEPEYDEHARYPDYDLIHAYEREFDQ